MTEITTLIGTLGFTIVMCLLMYRQTEKQNERLDAQSAKTTEAINKLEQAIIVLTERLTGGGSYGISDKNIS